MPLITTHNYFANDVLSNCSKNILKQIKDKKSIYELFAQGFDLFIFYEFFKFKKKNIQEYCHTHNTNTYFLNLIKNIKKEKQTNNPEILAALYGHLTHYILDSTCHPFIVYKTGEYNKAKPETKKYKGLHNKMEMQIDAYIYENRNKEDFNKFKIHKHLITKDSFSPILINILNKTYKETFNLNNGGKNFQKGKTIMYYSYKFLIEDSTGLKSKIYSLIDLLTPYKKDKFKYFSTYTKKIDEKIFNNEHNLWYNPWGKNINSYESFFDLYNKALKICLELFDQTNKFINDKITEKEYVKYLKNNSYLTGLPWNNKYQEIKYLEF